MAQVKVPKYIDVEDRVIGPLSLRQFFSLVIPAALITIFYVVTREIPFGGIIFLLAAVMLGSLGFSLAFIRVNELSFKEFFFAAINYYINPKKYVWRREQLSVRFKEEREAPRQRYSAAPALRLKARAASPDTAWSRSKIHELAQRLDIEEEEVKRRNY